MVSIAVRKGSLLLVNVIGRVRRQVHLKYRVWPFELLRRTVVLRLYHKLWPQRTPSRFQDTFVREFPSALQVIPNQPTVEAVLQGICFVAKQLYPYINLTMFWVVGSQPTNC